MNRGELEALAASYMHRTDLAGNIPGFISLATARLARDLRSVFNETFEEISVAADPTPLPDDFRAMRSIAQNTNGGSTSLRYVGAHEITKYRNNDGQAMVYTIRGREMQIRPYQAGTYTVDYYNAPAALTTTADTNDVLENYPYLYLYATLIEGYIFIQDESMAASMLNIYSTELEAVNAESKKSRTGDAPAMRAV